MKNFVKHLTMGAVLGLAVMVGGAGQAHATLLNGQTIATTFDAPGNLVIGPTNKVVSGIVELPNFGGVGAVDIDLSDTMITITALNAGTFFNPAEFRFVDVFDTIPNWVASLSGLTTMTTITGSDVTFTANDIFVNVSGLLIAQGQTIVLDVAAAPVPEPSTMLLFGSGLAGIVAWRFRKSQA